MGLDKVHHVALDVANDLGNALEQLLVIVALLGFDPLKRLCRICLICTFIFLILLVPMLAEEEGGWEREEKGRPQAKEEEEGMAAIESKWKGLTT